MIASIFTPHLASFASWFYYQLKAFYDRGFTCDKRNTRKLVQEDYEKVYLGEEFLLEFRYAQLVNSIYICFMLSSGIPLLYFITFLTFLVTYWIDKYLSK